MHAFTIPELQMRKPRLKEMNCLQSYIAKCSSDYSTFVLTLYHFSRETWIIHIIHPPEMLIYVSPHIFSAKF